MHVRYSTVLGLPIVENGSEEAIAIISGVLIHPDLGKIEGFFVQVPSFLRTEELFLSVSDIVHWGKRVRIRDRHSLSSLEDVVRLHALQQEGRSVLDQPIVTEEGTPLGRCRDIQFNTLTFYLEWIFPKRFFRWGTPLPVSSIVLVRPDAVVVRNAATLTEVASGPTVLSTLDPMGTH